MSKELIALLEELSAAEVVLVLVFIISVAKIVYPWFLKLKNLIIKKNKEEEHQEDINQTVGKLEKRMSEYEKQRLSDREQSLRVQQNLVDSIQRINKRLSDIQEYTTEKFDESKAREERRVRAELKDRISQAYRYYHAAGKWNTMEKEALEDLIKEYEEAGGENSFVHTVVQKELYTWDLIDSTDTPQGVNPT